MSGDLRVGVLEVQRVRHQGTVEGESLRPVEWEQEERIVLRLDGMYRVQGYSLG